MGRERKEKQRKRGGKERPMRRRTERYRDRCKERVK